MEKLLKTMMTTLLENNPSAFSFSTKWIVEGFRYELSGRRVGAGVVSVGNLDGLFGSADWEMVYAFFFSTSIDEICEHIEAMIPVVRGY